VWVKVEQFRNDLRKVGQSFLVEPDNEELASPRQRVFKLRHVLQAPPGVPNSHQQPFERALELEKVRAAFAIRVAVFWHATDQAAS